MKRNYCYLTLNIREIKHIKGMTAAMKLKDAPWKKSYEKSRQCIKKQRHTLQTKARVVKAMVLPVDKYGCQSWIIKKAEHRRIDAFKLWCWRES